MRRSLVVALAAVSAFTALCLVALWALTREASPERTPSAPERGPMARPVRPPSGAIAGALPAPQPEPQLILVPQFDTNARLQRGDPAYLRFRAERVPPGPLTGIQLAMSAFRLPDREETRLRVHEVGEGMYEVRFAPREGGQYPLIVTAPGVAARTSVPVILVVADEGAVAATTAVADNVGAARASGSRSARREAGGGARRGR